MKELNFKILDGYIRSIYKELNKKELSRISKEIKKIFSSHFKKKKNKELWNETDCFLITYADSIKKKKQENFETLNLFLDRFCKQFSFIHILPFYPFSSDDGFAVIDYKKIDSVHGSWKNFSKLSKNYKIMADLVINHCSSQNQLFKNFLEDKKPGIDFFICSNKDFKKYSKKVVRPRSSDLSKIVKINDKKKFVWCTFSHDQIDFNFKNPDVLIYFLKIIKFYIDKGVRALRLDAVAFLWKEVGTNCINLPQTHLIIRLIRLIIDNYKSGCLLITETNVPSHQNLSYFGNNNEAHCIYNFSLAPLVIHSIISENSSYLKQWSRSMPPAQIGNSYLNFLSTHDGIGLRPLEGLLPKDELEKFITTLKKSGSRLTYRISQNVETVYEVNTTLLDAFKLTYKGKDNYTMKRFILAHQILFSMEGIPAIYIQNLIGSKNDLKKLKETKKLRAINRRNWDYDLLIRKLNKKSSIHRKAFDSVNNLISLRRKQPAFHPNATQFTLQLQTFLFGIWRQSIDRSQSIFCISNLSKYKKNVDLIDVNLIATDNWYDILTNKKIKNLEDRILLQPYQSVWLTNKRF